MKLIINRFAIPEADGIDIPVVITTQFDKSGISQISDAVAQLESKFKKMSSGKSGLATSMTNQLKFSNAPIKTAYDASIASMKASINKQKEQIEQRIEAGKSTKRFTNAEKNERTLAAQNAYWEEMYNNIQKTTTAVDAFGSSLQKSLGSITTEDAKERLSIKVGDLFSQNKPAILEMDNAYTTVLDKFKDSIPAIENVGTSFKNTFSEYKDAVQSSYDASQLFKEGIDLTKVSVSDLANQVPEAYVRMKLMNNEMDRTEKSSNKGAKGVKRFATMIRSSLLIQIQALGHTLRRAFGFLEEAFVAAGDYVESMNLYTMSVGEYATAGREWAEEISNALYLDTSEIYQYTGSFFNLTRGLGATAKAADLMSRNLTQLTYDMSSYLNIDVSVANNKLMSAMSGQTKAVTSVGIAVQSASLQELAYSLNIDKAVESMTQAEKTYLRYIQIMRTTTQMQGDLGRTIITPTNAMRLLRTQINLLSRAIGQVFTPIIMGAIPYVIAFTQVLKEAAEWLANLMGYKLEDYLAPADSVKTLADGFGDLEDAADGAAASINRTLAPFDELNVVEMQGKGKSGGLDDSVLSELEQYLEGYDMLEFYTKNMADKIENAKKGFKDLVPIVMEVGAAFATWKIGSALINFLSDVYSNKGHIQQKVGLTLLVTSVALSYFGSVDIQQGKFWEGIGKQLGASFGTGVGTFLMTKNIKLALAATAFQFTINAVFDADNFWAAALNILGGSLTVAGSMLYYTKDIQLTFAVTVGYAVVSTIASLIFGGDDEESLIDKFKESRDAAKEFNDSLTGIYDNIYKNKDANLALVSSHEDLYTELVTLVDENGKVKAGYEDRVEFILNQLKDAYGVEYQLIDGQIQEYDKLKESIEKVIAKKKLEILLEANKEAYIEAIKHEREAIDGLNDSTKKLNTVKDKFKKTEDKLREATNKLTVAEELYKGGLMSRGEYQRLQEDVDKLTLEYEGQKEAVDLLTEEHDNWKSAVEKNTKAIAEYNDGLAASYSNDTEKINESINKMTGTVEGSLSEQLEFAKTKQDEMLNYYKKTYGEITDTQEKEASAQYRTVIETLKKQTQGVESLTPELKDAWKKLAEQDKDAFTNAIAGLDDDIKAELTNIPDVVKNDLEPKFEKNAAILGGVFAKNISDNMKIDNKTLKETLTNAIQNVKLPAWLKNTPMGKMASNLGFQFAANGGFFETGEMFIAREAGPEMVGRIGNKTAVANNDQITNALTNALTVALKGTSNDKPNTTIVNIGGKKVYEGIGNYIDSENDRYGTNYVKV